MSKNKNVKNLIMNILPDNRPITSLQIVEDYDKCPKNFLPINRTYDQDADADLWRETTILFGKRTGRYLCLSKSEGLPEYIVETLKVIADRELPPEGFSLLSRTADSEQKAWRKRQIAYKLSRRGSVTQAVTDIILCSKLRAAPDGFHMAGEINGIVICFKMGPVLHRPPPSVPATKIEEVNDKLHYMNITSKSPYPLPHSTDRLHHDYEEIRASYQIVSPVRKAPQPPSLSPQNPSSHQLPVATAIHHGTLGSYCDLDGIPFILNPKLTNSSGEGLLQSQLTRIMDTMNEAKAAQQSEYNFQLERQVMCTTKSSKKNSTNPFFK